MESLEINENIDLIVKGLEIGFIVEKSRQEGFLDVRRLMNLKNLDLNGDEIDFLFSQLEEEEIPIIY